MRQIIIIVLLGLSGILFGQDSLLVTEQILDEVSGIVCGVQNPYLYYVINDSGGKPEVYGLNDKGQLKAVLKLSQTVNRDWEDIAVGPGPEQGKNYIYVAETGDNDAKYPEIWLYRFAEPSLIYSKKEGTALKTRTINNVQKIKIQYADGAKDCESVFIDPRNGDAYLVSKREQKVGLYQIKAPLDTVNVNIASRVLTLDFPLAVAADISPERGHILIKTYSDVYCWELNADEAITSALSRSPEILPYIVEPQGEAVCFNADGNRYLTLSEKHEGIPLYMYIYPLKK